ncbi:NAD-dependent epimerase/dehydratase family protein [Aliihoeflea sp. PC F10.4]
MTNRGIELGDLSKSRILITGAASLVGSHTASLLLEEGVGEVVLFDNLAFGSLDAVAHLVDDPRVTVVKGDLMHLPGVIKATEQVDAVIHLAAYMSLGFSQTPWQAIDVNLRGVQNLLEACRVNEVRKLVFASSNAVYGYGDGIKGALHEDLPFHSKGGSASGILYGASKVMGEQLCRAAHQQFGLDYVVLRYSTVYGERQHYRAANALYIMDTYDAVRRGEAPVMPGDGSETKHFVHVSDVARANLAALRTAATDVAVNVSGPSAITVRELMQLVLDYCGSDLVPQTKFDEPGTVRLTSGGAFHIPNDKARDVIGWHPQVQMKQGIERLLAWREANAAANER